MQEITQSFAEAFADEWINAWNSHDLERILSHYSADFTIETPMAAILYPQSAGRVCGKEEVRAYWEIGLERIPDLNFELIEVLTGINGLTIYYKNTATGKRSAEMMHFNDEGEVCNATVHYSNLK